MTFREILPPHSSVHGATTYTYDASGNVLSKEIADAIDFSLLPPFSLVSGSPHIAAKGLRQKCSKSCSRGADSEDPRQEPLRHPSEVTSPGLWRLISGRSTSSTTSRRIRLRRTGG